MQSFEHVQVGQLWSSVVPPYDSGVALIKARSFDAVCFLSNPTAEEINLFCCAPLRVSVFVYKNVPFVAFEYEGTDFNWEVSLCFVGATQDQIDTFLEPGNLIALFLVDRKSGIVKAIRAIGIDQTLEKAIKEAAKTQFAENLTRDEFNRRVDEAYRLYKVEDFIKLGVSMEFKKLP